jgi:thiol-disulfide isomerase/thioredoxin
MKFLFFRASWCGPCNRSAPAVYELFDENAGVRENFTLEIIDIDEQPEFASRMGIRGLPSFVILDDNGKERSRRVGAMTKYKLAEWLETDFNSTLTLALKAPLAMIQSLMSDKCKL